MIAIDRRTLMQNAHRIARQARPFMKSYREALTYGLRAAWGQVEVARSFAAVRARVQPRSFTAEQIAAQPRSHSPLRFLLRVRIGHVSCSGVPRQGATKRQNSSVSRVEF